MAIGSISHNRCDEYEVGGCPSVCSVRMILALGGGHNVEALTPSVVVHVQKLIG